jgi:hypothetical protein
MVTPKRDISSDDADETIDLREMANSPRFLDSGYGIRIDGETLIIGNSTIDLDEPGVSVRGKRFKLTKGLWDPLTLKDVDKDTISPNDTKRYKRILEMTNTHLKGYEPEGSINISKALKDTNIISNLFPAVH